MDDIPDKDIFGEENTARRGRSPSAERRSSTSITKATLERKFNELISAIHNMTGIMQNKMTAINKFIGSQEAPTRHVSPPHSTPDEEEEPREEDKIEREPSLRRSHNLRDRGSTHHGSLSHQEHACMRSHSHKAPQGINPLLGRFLEEDVGKIGEKPIIPKPSKPMFVRKSANEVKHRIPCPLELNKILR